MIEKIQQVEDNWQKPWITIAANTRNFFPQNLTGRRYAGGNAFLLLFLCEKFQYQTPVFMTFNQANEAGISVLKGSKSFPVYYFLFYVYHKETRKKITFEEYKALSREQQQEYNVIPTYKYYSVFNLDQTNFSDVMMPEMGGDELCASVKSDIETSHIPVMLLTALGDEKDMLEGLENGADAYITKPFSINVLRANIRNILANRALLRRAYAGLEDGVGQVPPDCHNTRDWKFMASVRECVMKNIDNPGFCVDMLCGMQNMSRTGFFNKLKALTGHAPADYIRSMRLQYAAQLLREKDCSITEISDDSGFSDVRYFREVFRKYYGMSPSEYRNSMRG